MKNKKMLLFAGVLAAFLMLAVPFAVASVDSEDVDASDTGPVAMIGDNPYDTLQGAISASTAGQTIKIMKNVDIQSGISVSNSDVIIDLNGKTILGICDSNQDYIFMVNNGAQLTIKDSSIDSSGRITYAGNDSTGWIVDVEGKLILDSGTLELTGTWNIGYAVDVRPNAWGTEYTEPTVFIMNGGKVISSDGAVRVASSSSDTYDDISATFIMNGGEIDAAWDGVFIQQSNAAWDKLNFTMSGGAVKSDLNPIRLYGPAPTSYVNGEDCIDIALNGGTLTYTGTEVREWLIDGIIRIGGGATEEEFLKDSSIVMDGVALVGDVPGLSAALNSGMNIKFIRDISITDLAQSTNAFVISKPTIIDGQGHKISVSKTYDGRIFTVNTPGKVVIKNIEMEISGTYSRGVNFAKGCYNTEVVLEDVELNVGYYALNISQGINGISKLDVIRSEISGYAALNVWSDAEITFTDSKIFSENEYTVENEGNFSTIVINNALGDNGDGSTFRTDITFVRTELNAAASSTSTQNVINYRANTFGTVTFVDSRINGSGMGFAISIESEDVVVVVDESLIISDDSEMEILIEGTLELNGIINDNGEGSVTIGELTGNGYVTGSNVAAWASTGVQELDSDSKDVTAGTKEVDSDKNTVVIDTNNNVSVDELTVNLRDNGNNITVKFPAGTVVNNNALIHISESQSSMTESVFEVVINGIDNKDEDVFITIPRENNGLEPVVTWIDEDGRPIEDMRIHSDDGTSVTFITTHNSLYKLSYTSSGSSAPGFTPGMGTVTDEASEGFSTADYATMAGIVIAVVMLIGLFCIVRRN